ncbi:MAG: GNAT family N-acetyltransferase [Candidatus Omnitrophica bacterium]|nr:GNAT family N-acetyltransferase [Candidatus Omnitrophota bacterium]
MPCEQLTDLWDVRGCFHDHFKRKLFFLVAEENKKLIGLIPLCFVEEHNYYTYFPGEIWQKKTWIEQNRLIARDKNVFQQMLAWLEENNIRHFSRYLLNSPSFLESFVTEDEIGYLFSSEAHHHSMENYYSAFSRKSIKTIRREINRIYEKGLEICSDHPNDFEEMIRLNLERFEQYSYFSDDKFTKSFRSLRDYLSQKGWLRMTTLKIDSQVAAIDMGCVYNNTYTLLAGGTNSNYPGIAKVINMYHMEESCKKKYKEADFLCGDFSWKKLFHLTPRPLYFIKNFDEAKIA